MRENMGLFRGKRWEKSVFDKTDWLYGSLIDSGNHGQVAIYPWFDGSSTMSVRKLVYARMEGVNPETLGECTGLKDKNGELIFEGDIVDILTENEEIGVVAYEDGGFLVNADGFSIDFHANINGADLEVIGNIHDNPELLEV